MRTHPKIETLLCSVDTLSCARLEPFYFVTAERRKSFSLLLSVGLVNFPSLLLFPHCGLKRKPTLKVKQQTTNQNKNLLQKGTLSGPV